MILEAWNFPQQHKNIKFRISCSRGGNTMRCYAVFVEQMLLPELSSNSVSAAFNCHCFSIKLVSIVITFTAVHFSSFIFAMTKALRMPVADRWTDSSSVLDGFYSYLVECRDMIDGEPKSIFESLVVVKWPVAFFFNSQKIGINNYPLKNESWVKICMCHLEAKTEWFSLYLSISLSFDFVKIHMQHERLNNFYKTPRFSLLYIWYQQQKSPIWHQNFILRLRLDFSNGNTHASTILLYVVSVCKKWRDRNFSKNEMDFLLDLMASTFASFILQSNWTWCASIFWCKPFPFGYRTVHSFGIAAKNWKICIFIQTFSLNTK